MKKVLVTTLASVTLVCLAIVSSMGLPVYEPTQALIGYGMTIKLDGEEVQLHDVTGKRVYPLVRDGTTCIPVRGVSELLGLDVDWDGETNTVLLGLPMNSPTDLWTGKDENTAQHSVWIPNCTYLMDDNELYAGGVQFAPEQGGYFTLRSGNKLKSISLIGYNKYTFGDVQVIVTNVDTGTVVHTATISNKERAVVKCALPEADTFKVEFSVPKDDSRSGYAVAAGVQFYE